MVAEVQEPGEKEGPSFNLHFDWKGKPSITQCETLLKATQGKRLLERQGIKSFITEEED